MCVCVWFESIYKYTSENPPPQQQQQKKEKIYIYMGGGGGGGPKTQTNQPVTKYI